MEAKITAQKAQLEAELAIQEAEHEAGRREIEALLLKEDLDEFNLSDRMKDFEEHSVVGDKIKTKTTAQVKQDAPINDIEHLKQKVREWLKTVMPKGEETDEGKENDRAKHLPSKERIVYFSQSALSTSAVISSLPKRQLPVFDGDPCAWPNWYGMFKALLDDQQLSKTQAMIYVKASVKGTSQKAVAGMFFDGTMYDKAIAELTERFGNPTLISIRSWRYQQFRMKTPQV